MQQRITSQSRILLDECEPLKRADRYVDSLIARIEKSIDDQIAASYGKFNDETQHLKGDIRYLKDDIRELKKENLWLKEEKHILAKREIVCGVYRAIGHKDNTGRKDTFEWMRKRRAFLQDAFGWSEQQTEDLLVFLGPSSGYSLVTVGSLAAHNFPLADAMAAVGEHENSLRKYIEALANRYGKGITIRDASKRPGNYFAEKYEILAAVPKTQFHPEAVDTSYSSQGPKARAD